MNTEAITVVKLRKALNADKRSAYSIAITARVSQAMLSQFKNGKQGLSIKNIERLTPVVMPGYAFGLHLDEGVKEIEFEFQGKACSALSRDGKVIPGTIRQRE